MGRYIVTLTAYNQISSDTHRLELFVVDRVCRLPEFDIHSQVMDKDNKVNEVNKVGIHWLRRLDGRGHFKDLFTSFKRRVLYEDVGECSNQLSFILVVYDWQNPLWGWDHSSTLWVHQCDWVPVEFPEWPNYQPIRVLRLDNQSRSCIVSAQSFKATPRIIKSGELHYFTYCKFMQALD